MKLLFIEKKNERCELPNQCSKLLSNEIKIQTVISSMQEFRHELKNATFNCALVQLSKKDNYENFEICAILADLKIPFVFISSALDREIIYKAIKLKPLGFLTIPLCKNELVETISLLSSSVSTDFFVLNKGKYQHRIKHNDILFIRSENVYVTFYLKDERVVHRGKLSEIEVLLPDQFFFRCHQSIIINSMHLTQIKKANLTVGNNIRLPISRRYQSKINERIFLHANQ